MDENTLPCGMSACKPKWVAKLSHRLMFAILFTIVGIVQGTIFTAFVGSITTLEKRYAFGSKVTGIINLADNISPILLSIVIGYLASRGHRVRWCGVCITLSGISAVLFASPYLIFGSGRELMEGIGLQETGNANETYQLCGKVDQDCDESNQVLRNDQTISAVSLLFLANFISGIGSCGYYIIGAPLADDTFKSSQSPLYFAVLYSFRLAGPTIGFLLSSVFLKYYENPHDNPEYGSDDPRWVGAWWLSFVVIGSVLTTLGLLMMLFPRNSFGEDVKIEENGAETAKGKIQEIMKSLRMLIKNPILIFYNLAITCQLLGTIGYFVFLPKYLENEFQLSPSQSNKISGLAGILVMVFGFVGSGTIIYFFKPRPRYIMAWKVFAGFASGLGLLIVTFIGCDRSSVIGTSSCSNTCGCDLHLYTPVCNENTQQTFFSPCHAGCPQIGTRNGSLEVFQQCSCNEGTGIDEETISDIISKGACISNCSNLVYFIVALCLIKFFSSSGQIGAFLVMLRSVRTHEKTLAVSLNSTFLSAFALIPYPLIYGALVDSSCSIWEKSCSGTGHCWVYDTEVFRVRLHALTSALFASSAVLNIFTCYFSDNVKNMYGENDDVTIELRKDSVSGYNNNAFPMDEINKATNEKST